MPLVSITTSHQRPVGVPREAAFCAAAVSSPAARIINRCELKIVAARGPDKTAGEGLLRTHGAAGYKQLFNLFPVGAALQTQHTDVGRRAAGGETNQHLEHRENRRRPDGSATGRLIEPVEIDESGAELSQLFLERLRCERR